MEKVLRTLNLSRLKDQRGVSIILVAMLMFFFLGIAALAVDLSHLYVVRNELQNAADAGALAGARFLYNDYGTSVNAGANQIAYDGARANTALSTGGAIAVDVNWSSGQNTGTDVDVQRGHWTFATRTFTANDSLAPVALWNVPTEALDANPAFINAVRVVARRQATPAASFFAQIFGYQDFELSKEAVGYIGFAGTLGPGEADQPIAICEDSILQDDMYSCNIGRMINSGQNVATSETGGWTSFSQDNPCEGGTNANEVRALVCAGGNEGMIFLGGDIATNGGEIQSAFNRLISCWTSTTGRTSSWNLTLPVVECPGNNITTCQRVVGAVNLNVVWITGAGEDPSYSDAPTQMDGWSNSNSDGQARWASFVSCPEEGGDGFCLKNVDGTPAPYAKKSIYFKPDCSPHELAGNTGGENFGVLARIPVLVK